MQPSIAVKANPIPFALPNQKTRTKFNLSYRTIFAVLTIDTVLIYDTYHFTPLAMAQGLHYAGLTDCEWTRDGRHLIVSSSDGYISILSFDEGELGEVYENVKVATLKKQDEDKMNESIEMKSGEESFDTKLSKSIHSKNQVPEMKMMVVKKKKKDKKRLLLTPVVADVANQITKANSVSIVASEINVLPVKKKEKKRISVTTVVDNLEQAGQREIKPNIDQTKPKKRRIQVTNLSAL